MNPILAYVWKRLPLNKNIQLTLMRLFQDSFLVGTTGIIFNESGQVLLFRHTYRTIAWSLPGGYLKAREHPQEGLEREIEEESGLIVSIDGRLKIRTDRDTARLDICYIGFYLGGRFRPSAEVSGYGFYTLDNLPLISKDQLILIKTALKNMKRYNLAPSLPKVPPKKRPYAGLVSVLRRYLSL